MKLVEKRFATTGKALEKKIAKLIEKEGLTKSGASRLIKGRDELAKKLWETRRKAIASAKDFNSNLSNGAAAIYGKNGEMLRDLALNDVKGKSEKLISAIKSGRSNNFTTAMERHLKRSSDKEAELSMVGALRGLTKGGGAPISKSASGYTHSYNPTGSTFGNDFIGFDVQVKKPSFKDKVGELKGRFGTAKDEISGKFKGITNRASEMGSFLKDQDFKQLVSNKHGERESAKDILNYIFRGGK